MPIIDSYPEPFIAPSTASRMNFVFNILPGTVGSRRLTHWMPRLKVDGAEIKIKEGARLQKSQDVPGITLTAELLKVSDESAFSNPTTIEFGFGRKVGGVWDESTFVTLMSDAIVQDAEKEISGTPRNPTDRVSVTLIDQTTDRLNKRSATGLFIYDPGKVQLGDVTTIYDKQGNAYTPEVIAINGLKLSHLFQEIFVDRCGFSSYWTNLPDNDYPVDMYSVAIGQRFYDGLKGYIGMYSPAVYADGDIIRISDSTLPQPAGFPAPREVTLARVKDRLSLSQRRDDLDYLLLHFVGLENNYDFTAPRFEYPIERPGGSTVIEKEQIFIEFHKITGPGTSKIIRDPLNIENTTTKIDGVTVEESSNVFEFDSSGEYRHRRKTSYSRLPDLNDLNGGEPFLQRSEHEREPYYYQNHPFRLRSKYRARRTLTVEGLIAVDEDNPNVYGDPAEQAAKVALRSNNLADGQTFRFGRILTELEQSEPLRDGTVRTRTIRTDEVNPSVPAEETKVQPGDIGMHAFSTTWQAMPVFDPDDPAPSTEGNKDDFHIGPLPLKYGIPLAERVLKQRKLSNRTVSLPVIGYDESLDIGVPIAPKDRAGVLLGNFLIVGLTIDFLSTGLFVNLDCREIAESNAVLQEIPAYVRTIGEGEVLQLTLPIACLTGYELRVPQGAIPNVTIEARHVEVPELPWTNLETNGIDLSVWDGLTEDFEFRVTAGAVATITRVEFDLEVDVA